MTDAKSLKKKMTKEMTKGKFSTYIFGVYYDGYKHYKKEKKLSQVPWFACYSTKATALSGYHWKDLFHLQKLSVNDANFGQR